MKRKTLTQYLVEQQRAAHALSAEVRLLVEIVSRACKTISHAVSKGALGGVLGSLESENVQGEVQKKLDVMSNEVLLEANEWGGHLAAMASEEMETIHLIPNRYPKGEFLLLFDPLDGSSNIDVNVSIGTIFSVLRAPASASGREITEEDFLQPELEVMQSMLAAANQKSYVSSRARARMRAPEAIVESPQSLTTREKDILVLLLKGLSDVAIADALGISIYTVKDYGKSIRAKYNVKTRVQLISALLGRALHKGR